MQYMFLLRKDRCTQETTGTLIKKKWNGNVWHLTVEYTVAGIRYTCTEQLRYRITKKYKIGRIPIGHHATASLPNIEEGTKVRVMYNPDKPKKSYLPDNEGLLLS